MVPPGRKSPFSNPRIFYLLAKAAALLLVLGMSSCRTANGVEQDPGYSDLFPPDLPPLLDIAFEYLPLIESPDSQLFIMTSAARSLIANGALPQAGEILDGAALFARSILPADRRVEAYIDISRNYLDAGIVSRSLDLLEEALELSRGSGTPDRTGQQVQEIISVCFAAGSDAVDLLRQAVQRIYTVEEPQLRAELLIDTSRRYQESGEGQRANTLLQQAIPAAGSIADPLARARAFALLGQRFLFEDEARLAEVYSGKAVELLGLISVTSAPFNESQTQLLADTLVSLARSGYANEALTYSALLTDIRLRLQALLESARGFSLQGQLLQADLVFERIFSSLERDVLPDLVSSMLLNIAAVYQELGDNSSALIYLDAMSNYLPAIEDELQKDSLLLEASRLYSSLGNSGSAREAAAQISDPFYRSRAQALIASFLLESRVEGGDMTGDMTGEGNTNPQDEEFVRLLNDAAQIPQETPALKDVISSEISLLWARSGRLIPALELVAGMGGNYSRALSLAQLQAHVDSSDTNASIVEGFRSRVEP